jgi:hypothetical protein
MNIDRVRILAGRYQWHGTADKVQPVPQVHKDKHVDHDDPMLFVNLVHAKKVACK